MIASPAACIRAGLADRPISPECLTDRLGANLDGMLAQYAVLNKEAVVRLTSHLSNEEAATLPCATVTAWVALMGHRRGTAGDTVLTQGSGGVSVLTLQFAPALGHPDDRCYVELRNEVVSRTSASASVWGAVAVF